jgi:two-component system NarL family sensor kinase
VGVNPSMPPHGPAPDFLRLESRLLRHYFHLVLQERHLSDRVRRNKRTGGGRTAIRQIELERQRLGRDLHTGVGQLLVAIRMQLEIVSLEIPLPSLLLKQALERISTLSADALEQVRSVSKRLHPPEWQRLTVESALRQLWEISGVPQRFQATLEIDPLPCEPVPEVKALLYRAMQESLSNLVRHSKATCVQARLKVLSDCASLTIEDNGVGFDVERLRAAPANVASGIGLRSIREQVEGLGGNFDVESGPIGTKLVVSVCLVPRE